MPLPYELSHKMQHTCKQMPFMGQGSLEGNTTMPGSRKPSSNAKDSLMALRGARKFPNDKQGRESNQQTEVQLGP